MLIDGRAIPQGEIIRTEVCVIGAGPAGIAIALDLAEAGVASTIVEAGGPRKSDAGQRHFEGENVGAPYDLAGTRCRSLGGSSAWWAGFCSPFEPSHFERRPWIANSGWPIDRADLDPFYRRAAITCGLDPDAFEPSPRERLAFDAERLTQGALVVQASQITRARRNFGRAFRDELRRSDRVRVLLNAPVARLETDDDGRTVTRAHVLRAPGEGAFEVEARLFVLGAGAIENARLLLLSNDRIPAGLGNGRDVVGRYFMEHPRLNLATMTVRRRGTLETRRFSTTYSLLRSKRCLHLHLSAEAQRLAGAGHGTVFVNEQVIGVDSPGARSIRHLFHEAKRRHLPPDLWGHGINIAVDWKSIAQMARWYGLSQEAAIRKRFLRCVTETAPNPDSRVTLGHGRDEFGLPRVRLDWRLTEDDAASVRRMTERLCAALSSSGALEATPAPEILNGEWMRDPGWTWHQMGTTRMGRDPRVSVVDADCRVHDVANLYVAGSSVFATAGNHSPTFTLLALGHRLGARLLETLRAPAVATGRERAPAPLAGA